MYTYGYIREAVLAHIDLSEEEAQAMDVLKRLPIFANEAMQAICAVKPHYYYYKVKIVNKFNSVVRITYTDTSTIGYREMTDADEYYLSKGKWPEGYVTPIAHVELADETETNEYYHNRGIYSVGEEVRMDDNFIAFVPKQAYLLKKSTRTLEQSLTNFDEFYDWSDNSEDIGVRIPICNGYYTVLGNNKLRFNKAGNYEIPCKGMWHRFNSGIQDDEEIDMPSDLLICIPLYIAAIILEIDQAQKAQIKRSEFEIALARANSTDMLSSMKIKPSYY